MIIIGIILGFVGLAYLCWLLFALAVYALPLSAAVAAGLLTYHTGSGPIGAATMVTSTIIFCTQRPLGRIGRRPASAHSVTSSCGWLGGSRETSRSMG